jgi:hypothetical protein
MFGKKLSTRQNSEIMNHQEHEEHEEKKAKASQFVARLAFL